LRAYVPPLQWLEERHHCIFKLRILNVALCLLNLIAAILGLTLVGAFGLSAGGTVTGLSAFHIIVSLLAFYGLSRVYFDIHQWFEDAELERRSASVPNPSQDANTVPHDT
jgi:nicotinamide riboside transporter PnuC